MGIFDWFRKNGSGSEVDFDGVDPPSMHLAMVLLREPALPEAETLQTAYQEEFGGRGLLTVQSDEKDAESDGESSVLVLDVQGVGSCFVALMPASIPDGEAEAAFEFSMSSMAKDADLEPHNAHLIVNLMQIDESLTPTEVITAFTSILAAVVKSTPSVGVYWGNVHATHAASFFLNLAADDELAPKVMLWNGFSKAQEEDGRISLLSLGMHQLALPDLYLVSQQDPGETLGRFFDLLSYIAARGEAIPAGNTVGASDTERIPVRYVKSPADNETVVWRVEM